MKAHPGFSLLLVLASCGEQGPYNLPPTAAIVVQRDGADLDPAEPIALGDGPIQLTLDGRSSTDADGRITSYRWFRTDVPGKVHYGDLLTIPAVDGGETPEQDAGSTFGPFDGDPEGKARVEVSFDAPGSYRYSLYVRDDAGAVSEPASVRLVFAPAGDANN